MIGRQTFFLEKRGKLEKKKKKKNVRVKFACLTLLPATNWPQAVEIFQLVTFSMLRSIEKEI